LVLKAPRAFADFFLRPRPAAQSGVRRRRVGTIPDSAVSDATGLLAPVSMT
jgi:hypothetical protein